MAPSLDLELIRQRPTSEHEVIILNALSRAVQSATVATAQDAAWVLDSACPPLEQHDKAHDYIWAIWEVIADIARSPDVELEVHESLVRVLESLRSLSRGQFSVAGTMQNLWGDLPLFSMCLEASFDDPTMTLDLLSQDEVQSWRNINLFGARCLGANLGSIRGEAMHALCSGLEEEEAEADVLNLKLQVTCDWLIHGGESLLRWAHGNDGTEDFDAEDEVNYFDGGELYDGPPIMCLERWAFWRERLGEALEEDDDVSEETRQKVLETVQTMKDLEARIGQAPSVG